MSRRLVGIDLGIASSHTVRVLDEDLTVICRRRCEPTVQSLSVIEAAALAGADPGTRLEVVFEPTGPAWLPVAVFFAARGHLVYRVSSAKSADLRRFLSHHAKSNSIDADTLARLPLFDPAGSRQVEFPEAQLASLDRRVRACDRLTRQGAEHKVRIKDLVHQVLPMTPLSSDLGAADLVVLERFCDPQVLLAYPRSRLVGLIAKASHGQQGPQRAQEWRDAAQASIDLYGQHPAVAYTDLAAEIATEVRILRQVQAEYEVHAKAREQAYQQVDPDQLARTLPGLAQIGGPVLTAVMARPARFSTSAQFVAYAGLSPRASETGDTDRKGQPMSKAGSALLRTTLVRAADHARKQDPQLARVYYTQIVERGANHLKASCVVAARLAARASTVMRRGTPYVIRDTNGEPVTAQEATKIIADHWAIPPEVRARRRSRKTAKRKAPQRVHEGHDQRGDLPQPRSSSTTTDPVNSRTLTPTPL